MQKKWQDKTESSLPRDIDTAIVVGSWGLLLLWVLVEVMP
jgi:hypothetical protein